MEIKYQEKMNSPNPPSILPYMASLLSKSILSCLGIVDSIVDTLSHSAAPSGSQIPLPCLNSICMFLNKPENTHSTSSKLALPFISFLLWAPCQRLPPLELGKSARVICLHPVSTSLPSGTVSPGGSDTHEASLPVIPKWRGRQEGV